MKPARYSKNDYVKSSPYFFRLIGIAVMVLCIMLFCGAVLVPSPLMGPADPGSPPNPAKSAWFLLWIQELVSHGNFLIYPAISVGIIFVLLPWLPLFRAAWRASWLPRGQMLVNLLTIAVLTAIIAMSIIAAFFRGPLWKFVSPF